MVPTFSTANGNPTGLASFNAAFSNQATLNAYSIRVDHVVNSRLSLFGRYNYSPSELITRSGDSYSVNTIFNNQVSTTTLTGGLDLELSSPT
jgi:hypothetical protein